ncbi:MAG: AAA family ATPase, partial [Desulfosarcinaceae bacterium]
MSISNPELQLAEEFVQHTNCHIFLTGKAGTGKTTFLHHIKNKSPKRLVVTAPTGVAAINAGGVTLHSFFQLPLGPFVPGSEAQLNQHRMRKEKKNIMKTLDLLVIDEISMVRADLLDGVDTILRRYRRNDLPFGGVQLLMIGDLQQLPPVVKKPEWQLLQRYYDSPYFFSSAALGRTEWIPIELKHIYRQSDQHFIELLNRVRGNRLDSGTLEKLNARHIPDFSARDGQSYITLCSHNRSADAINETRLNSLEGQSLRFNAELEGDFPEQAYPTAAELEFKTGAQVMFIRNDMSADKKYFNGKIGEITSMSPGTVEVACPGDPDRIKVEKTTWENIEYSLDPDTAEISQKVIGTFSQYPLKLAWAITIHKS